MKQKILICGATGFMGRNIFEHFLKNTENEVYGTSCTKNAYHDNIYHVDLKNENDVNHLVKSLNPDIIIQAAATTSGVKDTIERPYIHVTNNAVMNSILLRASYEYSVKQFIFLSCGVMYQPGDIPKKESDYNENDEIFKNYFGIGWTKVYIEKMMEFYSRFGRTKYLAIRHTNTYGPYDKYDFDHSHVFGITIRKVLEAKDTIDVWGNGTETARDLLYVSDVVDFIDLAIQKQKKQYDLVNVSLGKFVTIKELVEKIIKISGKNIKINYDQSKPAIATKLCLDNTYALSEYEWFPKVSLDEGIEKTMYWVKENIHLQSEIK